MRTKIRSGALSAASVALALSACTVGPDFHRPEEKAPVAWLAQPAAPSIAVAAEVDETWWNAFDDRELSALVDRLVRQHLDLAAAAERIQQARAQHRVTRSAGLPQVGLREQYTRERLSPDGPISLFEPSPGAPLEIDDWTQALTHGPDSLDRSAAKIS